MSSPTVRNPGPLTSPLDGPREARRRAPRSPCRRFSYVLLLLSVVDLLLYTVYPSISRALDTPARALYFEANHSLVNSTDEYLRPLINEEQTFDIAFLVWQRISGDGARIGHPACTSAGRIERAEYELVHSSIAFSGLKMLDKHVRSQVSFRVPVVPLRAILRNPDMNISLDALTASFRLIPSSSSPFDRLVGVNTSRPLAERFMLGRPWQPGNKETELYEDGQPCNRTLQDFALSTLAVSTPLVVRSTRMEINVSNNSVASAVKAINKTQVISAIQEIGDNEGGNRTVTFGNQTAPFTLVDSWYLNTRFQLRMISETHLLNASEYHHRHAALVTECGERQPGHMIILPMDKSTVQNCTRTYKTHGHVESVFTVTLAEEEDSDNARTELRYAPYFDLLRNGNGPEDFLPITHVQSSTETPSDDEYINVTIKLSYRGVGALQALLADTFIPQDLPHFNASEHEQRLAQDKAEMTHGVFGHSWRDDQHPRRRAFLLFLNLLLQIVCDALYWTYWFNLHTTAGVSTFPILVVAGLRILERGSANWANMRMLRTSSAGLSSVLFLFVITVLVSFVTSLVEIRGAARVRISWRPTFRRLPPTHRERASARLDSRISTGSKALAVLALGAALFLLPDRVTQLMAALPASLKHPPPPSTPLQAAADAVMRGLKALHSAANLIASVAQLILNHRQGQFAGRYKLEAALRAVSMVIVCVLIRVPLISGTYASQSEMTLQNKLYVMIWAMFLWQAYTLPKVPREEMEVD